MNTGPDTSDKMPCGARGWAGYAGDIASLLLRVRATDSGGKELSVDAAVRRWADMAEELRGKKGEISFVGNGASAAMSIHCAADILKNGRVRTRVYTDPALLTATGNDVSYEASFAVPLALSMRHGDMLVAVSSSGASPNIIAAAKAGRPLGSIVTLSAFSVENPLRMLGDINFYVPTPVYGLAETCHAALLHYWTDFVVAGAREQS